MTEKILLDPVDFDALHLSALAFGGIGRSDRFAQDGHETYKPYCVVGHANWMDGAADRANPYTITYNTPTAVRWREAGLDDTRNDVVLAEADVELSSFEEYIKLLNIDVKAVA